MNIIIANGSDEPIYMQIVKQIKHSIMNGELKDGEQMPSIRSLARELNISVITTKRAYQELENDKFITTMPQKGSYVNASNKDILKEAQIREIENSLSKAMIMAQNIGIHENELIEILKVLYQEGK